MMKQTKVFRMMFACLLFGISITTVSAQTTNTQGSSSVQGSEQIAKKQMYLNQAAAYEQQKMQSQPVTQKKFVTNSRNLLQPTAGGLSQTSAPAADRKERLLQLKAVAAAKGLSTAKYDLELQKLNN